MKVSDRGLAFIARHEGFVSKGYLDPVGIVTIGYGFTMQSLIFARWWRTRHDGLDLKVGDVLSREDANCLLLKMLDEEYAPPVAGAFQGISQASFDACVSVVYNLGPRALGWKWASFVKTGDLTKAAKLLAQTGRTAGGIQLTGLIRRRRAEALLLETGDYGYLGDVVRPVRSDALRLQKSLKALGFDPGFLDGVIGDRTRDAISAFQRANPPLLVDGIAGPATLATLARVQTRRKGHIAAALSSAMTAVVTLVASGPGSRAMFWTAGVFLVLLAASRLWRHRGWIVKQAARHVFRRAVA